MPDVAFEYVQFERHLRAHQLEIVRREPGVDLDGVPFEGFRYTLRWNGVHMTSAEILDRWLEENTGEAMAQWWMEKAGYA